MQQQITLALRATVEVKTEETVDVLPGKQLQMMGRDKFRWMHKQEFAKAGASRLEQSDFFKRRRFLKSNRFTLRDKTTFRIDHKKCQDCSGSGKQRCSACQGTSRVTCRACGGNSEVKTSYTSRMATKKVRCKAYRCSGGQVALGARDGLPVTETCGACHGTGWVEEHGFEKGDIRVRSNCSTCRGQKTIKCKACKGGTVGACKTCEGSRRITEVFSLAQYAVVHERIHLPKRFQRYRKMMAGTLKTMPSRISRFGYQRQGERFTLSADFDLDVAPAQNVGNTIGADLWAIQDVKSKTVWHAPMNFFEKILNFFGFGPKPPF